MFNTNMEINTHLTAIDVAHGNVLVTGLGLGMFLTAILQKPELKSITVIEQSEEVIQLVAPYFQGKKSYDY